MWDGRSPLPALPPCSQGSHEQLPHLTFLQHPSRAHPDLLRGDKEHPATFPKVETVSLLSADVALSWDSSRPHTRGAAGAPKGISREQSCSDNSSFKPKQRLLQSSANHPLSNLCLIPSLGPSLPVLCRQDTHITSTPQEKGKTHTWRNKNSFTQQPEVPLFSPR